MYTLTNIKTHNLFYSIAPVGVLMIFLFLATFACAGNDYIKSEGITTVTKSEPVPFDLIPEFSEMITPDEKQQVYLNYIISSINISQGKYKEAIDNLKKVMAHDPDSSFLKKKLALLFYETQNLDMALKYAEESLLINPDDIGTKLLLANLYSVKGDHISATTQYEEALILEPENQKVRMFYATSLARAGLLDKALIQLNTITDSDPDLFFAHYYKGRIYQAMKKFELAEKEYQLTLSLNNTMEPAFFDLAGLYYMQGKLDNAADTYKNLLKIYPMNRMARERLIGVYELLGKKEEVASLMEAIVSYSTPGDPSRQAVGLYYLQRGRLKESIDELGTIISTWPGDQKSRYYLAMAYEQDGQKENALYHFRLIQKGNELYINSRIHIAYLLNGMGKTDEAIDIINEGIAYKSDEIDLYTLLAAIYETKEYYGKARETLSKVLEFESNNIELTYRLGVLLDKEGNKNASIAQMVKVIELDPNHADSLNYLGYSYAEKGIRLDEALELVQKALKIKPESGYIIDSLGWVYFQRGNYDLALSSLKKAFSLISRDPTIAEHLGDVYLKINKYEKSLEMYQKALSLNHQSADKILKKIEDLKNLLE